MLGGQLAFVVFFISPTGTSLGTRLRVFGLPSSFFVRLQLIALSLVRVFPRFFGLGCRPRRLSMISMHGGGRFFTALKLFLLRLRHRSVLLCQLGGGRMPVHLAYLREESLLQVRIIFFTLLLVFRLHTSTICLMFLKTHVFMHAIIHLFPALYLIHLHLLRIIILLL